MANVLDTLVSGILVETAWGPPIFIPDPFRPAAPGEVSAGDFTGQILKPKITVTFRTGDTYVSKPYGDPGPSKWGYIQIGAALLSLGVLYVIFAKQRRRRLSR